MTFRTVYMAIDELERHTAGVGIFYFDFAKQQGI